MWNAPTAWAPAEPEWIRMAPGVSWLLLRPDGAIKTVVASDVATVINQIYGGRAGLEALGLDPEVDTGEALKLDRLAGYAQVLSACLYAKHCLRGWRGIVDPNTLEPLDHTDPENIKAALLRGPPPEGSPLLAPFLSWIEGPRRPMLVEAALLRKLARDHWSGGAERCQACIDAGDGCAKGASFGGELCPRLELAPQTPEGILAWSIASTTSGLWVRAGMSAILTGLDFRAALLAFEAEAGPSAEAPDFGAAFTAFRSIEAGRMEAEAARAEAEKTDG